MLSAQPNLKLPAIFGDNMVLQRNSEIRIWGNGKPNSEVLLRTSWGRSGKTKVNADSSWQIKVKTTGSSKTQSFSVSSGGEEIKIQNILFGEIWLCSGQSNMEMPLQGWPPNDTIMNSKQEIQNAVNKSIRFFSVIKATADEPLKDCTGKWVVCSPEEAAKFSATAFYFGKELYKNLNVPVGLIHSSWGGTPNEAWMSKEYAIQYEEYKGTIEKLKQSRAEYTKLQEWLNSHKTIDIVTKTSNNPWKDLSFDDEICSSVTYDDTKWGEMILPILWEQSDLGQFDGVVWFRKNVIIPKTWLNKELKLELSKIDDMDRTFINGKQVGATETLGEWQTKRIYTIPAEAITSDTLLIAVRVIDNYGGGGIYGAKDDMKISVSDTSDFISISGTWRFLPVAECRDGKFFVFGSNPDVFTSRPKITMKLSAYTPTLLYNAMISPLVPFTIKGVIWYQGEANIGSPDLYTKTFPAMIKNWREKFLNERLPFYYVQIAPYNYGSDASSQYLRESQFKTLSLENTGMAVTMDISNTVNIHPANKHDVGKRLSLWALANTYKKKLIYSGPLYKSMKKQKGSITLTFNHVNGGLKINPLKGENNFQIAGSDKVFKKAVVVIKGDKLIVSHPEIKNPEAVRYCWSNTEEGTLFNKAGLPASSFRTDDWK